MSRYETEQQAKERKEREQLELFRQEKLAEDVKRLLQRDDFKRVMSEIIGMGGMFQTVFTGNSQTFYRAGRADYAKQIFVFLSKIDKDNAFELLKTQNLKEG